MNEFLENEVWKKQKYIHFFTQPSDIRNRY